MTTVLFDLDGTLLPMDQEVFTKAYFKTLCAKVAPLGYEPQALVKGVWTGTAAMVQNDGSRPNEEAFWQAFCAIFGERARAHIPVFSDFYANEFAQAQTSCGFNPAAKRAVDALRARGVRVALATNPIFPAIATQARIRWAGLAPSDFALYTTYENSTHCKPNPDYYRDVLAALGAEPADCVMVGNDVDEDMIAETLGMRTFLLTDCLINKHERDIDAWPHGDFDALERWLAHSV